MDSPKISAAILFILAVNCFISPVYALNLDYYGIESRVQEDTTVLNSVTLTFNTSLEKVDYRLRYRAYNIIVESAHAPAECENYVTDTTLVSCKFTNYQNYDITSIKINFEVRDIVKKIDEDYAFDHFVPMEENLNRFFNIIYLPQTATLATEVPNESFSPRNGEMLSDGRHIMVYWDRQNIEKGEDMYFSVNYKMPQDNAVDAWGIGLAVVIAMLIIASLGVFYIKTTRKQDSMKALMPLMKKDEKTVIDILSKHEGSVNQKIIVRESDFSKAKVSRIIAGLKERGVVGVESMGRSNKITLKLKR